MLFSNTFAKQTKMMTKVLLAVCYWALLSVLILNLYQG